MAVKSCCPKTRRAVGFLFFAGGLASLGVSVLFFVEGWPSLQIAHVLKYYKEEFSLVEGKCSVSFVERCYKTTSDANDPYTPRADRDPSGTPHCWQQYSPRFSLPAGGAVYTDYPEFLLVGAGACPSEGAGAHGTCDIGDVKAVPSGKIESGKSYACWRPSGMRYDVRYQCGNEPCIKLTDPAAIVEPAIAEATRTFTIGSVLACVGLVVGLLSLCVWPMSGLELSDRRGAGVTVHRPEPETISKERRPWSEKAPSNSELKKPLSPKKKTGSRDASDRV